MELKKLLTILVVSTLVLAAMSTVIEAQRGGGSGGGMGGGHHWSVNAGSDNNVGDNNNEGIEVYVSTDKQRYVLNEPIEIMVRGYNPNDFTITLEFGTSSTTGTCQASYTIDGISPASTACNDAIGNFALPPGGSVTWTRTHTEDIFPLSAGIHSIVGKLSGYVIRPIKIIGPFESDPITIQVTDSNNGGMG